MTEAIIVDGGVTIYIIGTILATAQALSAVAIWYLKRHVTKAQAALTEAQAVFTKAQAANETADAAQTTANSFDTLTGTITKMATDFSSTLMKTIDLVNSREKRIDELEENNREKTSDLKELHAQVNDFINVNVQRDNKIELQQKSIDSLVEANQRQASELERLKEDHVRELIELKARILGLQDDNKKKDDALIESNRQILSKDERIQQLEERVQHLEDKIKTLEEKVPENPT